MSSVGLLYVGAVLFINGLMLIDVVPAKAAAAMNLFVGGMQVIFPTIIIAQAGGDQATILGASGLYLFGFTYLYVAWNTLTEAPGEGLGWFSLFVSCCAVVYGVLQFTMFADPVFGVIWFAWAVLWFLFFLLLGLGKAQLGRLTGWFTLWLGIFSGAIPALLMLSGGYVTGPTEGWIAAVLALVLLALSWALGKPRAPGSDAPTPAGARVAGA
ncbi:signal transduction histidine kinase [Leucobacter exalbidus]|uniref:Signal transduction histidine kinase n=1 Tax=Leucobacter exalbidus TaxID=662960 RepID=A0A940PU27_9MICO|nr:AmiS/UreI family transporter [Leucobacter exalbidus]MBP1327484.1 signal transduction histidine kinase [Leucobacter exalbidus]